MYVIYNQATTEIIKNVRRSPYRVISQYKTMAAAKAAMTRMHKKFEAKRFELLASKYSFERDSKEAKAENSPLYTCGIAEVNHYHKRIERQVKRINMMSGAEYYESVNTPNYCSPSSEAYWSM